MAKTYVGDLHKRPMLNWLKKEAGENWTRPLRISQPIIGVYEVSWGCFIVMISRRELMICTKPGNNCAKYHKDFSRTIFRNQLKRGYLGN